MSLCCDKSWYGQDFSYHDSVFRVTTEIAHARILLSRQRILCRHKVLAEPDEFCHDRTCWVVIEPAATENSTTSDKAGMHRRNDSALGLWAIGRPWRAHDAVLCVRQGRLLDPDTLSR